MTIFAILSPWIPHNSPGSVYPATNWPHWSAWMVHCQNWSWETGEADPRLQRNLCPGQTLKHSTSFPAKRHQTILRHVRASMLISPKYTKNWVGKGKSKKYWKGWGAELIEFLRVVTTILWVSSTFYLFVIYLLMYLLVHLFLEREREKEGEHVNGERDREWGRERIISRFDAQCRV